MTLELEFSNFSQPSESWYSEVFVLLIIEFVAAVVALAALVLQQPLSFSPSANAPVQCQPRGNQIKMIGININFNLCLIE